MISNEERRYLYWLAARVWTGSGDIVEIGPWLGGSTYCLAAGMCDSGHPADGRLKVFDNFIWRAFMAARAPLELRPGDSFEPHFRRNIEPFRHVVRSYVRALPDEPIAGDAEAAAKRSRSEEAVPAFASESDARIEILFVDGAKSVRGMTHLLRVLAHRMQPANTLVVCQDFKYWGTYWVPILMARLRAWITLVHDVLSGTTLTFRLDRRIPQAALGDLPDHVADLPTEESLVAIDWAARLLDNAGDPDGAWPVRLAAVSLLAHQGDTARALEVFRRCQAAWPAAAHLGQLDRAAQYLAHDCGLNLRLPLRWRIAGARRRLRHIASGLGRIVASRLSLVRRVLFSPDTRR
jgi:hypothetical protein